MTHSGLIRLFIIGFLALAIVKEPRNQTHMTGAVLRNHADGRGWVAMDDGSHRPLGIIETRTTARYIEIIQHGGERAVAAIATADNNMAQAGYTIGVSGGRDRVTLSIFKDGKRIDPRTISIETLPLSNIWFFTLQRSNNWGPSWPI